MGFAKVRGTIYRLIFRSCNDRSKDVCVDHLGFARVATMANSLAIWLCWATCGQCALGRSVNQARDPDSSNRDVFGGFDQGGTISEHEMKKVDQIRREHFRSCRCVHSRRSCPCRPWRT